MKRALLIALVAFLALLGGCHHSTAPTPLPSTSPSSTPTPPPPSGVGALRPTGHGFVDSTGQPVTLRGISYVPPDSKVVGWPSWLDDSILDEVKTNGGNFVAARLGPYTRDGEGLDYVAYESVGDHSRVNLDQWNPSFWNRVRSFTQAAASRGIYVEFDLIDAWVLERPSLSPWTQANNVNGYDGGNCQTLATEGPDYHQQRWLNKIGEELGAFPNVLFQISNESGEGNCQGLLNPRWELGVYSALKSNLRWRGWDFHPIGTNSHDSTVEEGVDYVERHGCSVVPLPGRPAGVNEWNCSLSSQEFCQKAREARGLGGWFVLWGDGMDPGEWREALKCLGQ